MREGRPRSFYVLAIFFAAYVLFLYGPMIAIYVLSFQGPQGGLTFPMNGVSTFWIAKLFQGTGIVDLGAAFRRSLLLGLVVMVLTVVLSVAAGMAFQIGMKHPGAFRGVIPVGGWLEPAEYTADEAGRARKQANFLLCHSPADRVVTFESAEKAVAFLAEESIPHQLHRYEGGHSIPKDLAEMIVDWMKAPDPERETKPGGRKVR